MRKAALALVIASTLASSLMPRYHGVEADTTTASGPVKRASGIATYLKGIACPSTTLCLTVGDGGTILATTNGGVTWTPQQSGVSSTLYSVACPTTAECYVVGASGVILVTSNGGNSWVRKTSTTTANLYAIACPSTYTCFAAGALSSIVFSSSGGTNWVAQPTGTNEYFYGITCPSGGTCYAVGSHGAIVATTNNGSSWIIQKSGTSNYLRGIACSTTATCTVVGDGGVSVATSSSGASWSVHSSSTSNNLQGIACPSGPACVAVGGAGAAAVTANGGTSWTTQQTGTTNGLQEAACPTVATCLAVGDAGSVVSLPAPTPAGGTVQDYPRIADVNGFMVPAQASTYRRYGLLVAQLSAATSLPSALAALKTANPATSALLYLNSSSVHVPGFDGLNIYPGWWLTLAGTTLSAAIDASTTTIPVANASLIAATLSTNPDVLVDGESMHVSAVNTSANTLTVQRGYNSSASAHNAGARLAAHALKWSGTWMLNVTPYCPVNPATGQTWTQYLAQQAKAQLASGPWNGLHYDDSPISFMTLSNGALDANNDNVPDGGDGPSGTGWADGENALVAQTRALVPGVLILSGATTSDGQEFEAFPNNDGGWSNAFATYLRIAAPSVAHPVSIINPDTGGSSVYNFPQMRMGLATALMGNGYFSYDSGHLSHGQTWWFDEYDNGQGSSLAASINATQTTLTLAAGTGSRFKVGDVVRVPLSDFTAGAGTADDEQMLVTGVNGDTLTVQRGYNGTLAETHGALTAVRTDAQLAAGQGWLGQPLGPAASLALSGPNLLTNGDFEGSGSGWLSPWSLSVTAPAVATVSQDTTTAATGHASAKITVSTATPGSAWDAYLVQTTNVVKGNTYTLTFHAKASGGQQVLASLIQSAPPYATRAKQWVTLTGNWQTYTLTYTATTSEAIEARVNVGQATGTYWIDTVSLQQGDPNVWRRDFAHGTVLLNATSTPQTVTLGSGYRRIAGTQDPLTNNGQAVSSVTLPPQDGLLLVKTS